MDTRLWFKTAVVLLVALTGSATAQRMEKPLGPLPLGSVWTNQVANTGSFGSDRSEIENRMVELMWDGQKVLGAKNAQTTLVFHPSGGWMGMLDKSDKELVRWDPPLTFAWPLEVGKNSIWGYVMKFPGQQQATPVEVSQSVESFEDVTVPAGTYKAFRIKTTDTQGNVNMDWVSPELGIFVKRIQQRTDKSAQGPGRRESELKSHDIRR